MSFFVPSFSLLFSVLLVLLSPCCTIKGELEGGSGGGERLKRNRRRRRNHLYREKKRLKKEKNSGAFSTRHIFETFG